MAQDYTITAARNAGEKDNPHGGTLVRWYLKLADSEAGDDDVYSQKKPGNDLSPGMTIYGRLEKGEFGWRIFPEQNPNAGGGNFQAPRYERVPDKQDYWDAKDRRIEWAWACNLAAAELGPGYSHEQVVERARIIRKQAREELAGADVGGGNGTDAPLAPAADVSAEASPQLKGKATQLMNKAGLAEGARKAVILFRCGTLKAPPKDRLLSLVRDLEDGASHDSLLAEVRDAHRAGNNPLATAAMELIPPDVPADTEGLPELNEENKAALGVKDAPPF